MADPRLAAVLDRIDRALDRLEARDRPDPLLPARHEALRRAMQEAVAGLDRLIGPEEQP